MISPQRKIGLGHAIEAIINRARHEKDTKALQDLSFSLREAASRVDGIASGLNKSEEKRF